MKKNTIKTLCFSFYPLALLAALSGCTLITPYTPPVQQGKIIQKNIMQKIKPGMTKAQIQYLLGSPDIQSPLDHNQWYYVYTFQRTIHPPREERKLILSFENDKLASISGDYPPPQTIYLSTEQPPSNTTENSKTNSQKNAATA